MTKMTIKITHVGEDYAGVEFNNGEYQEISLNELKTIKLAMKIIDNIVNS